MAESTPSANELSRDDAWLDPGHGDSPAAWTAVIIMLAGVAFGTLFFVLDMPPFVWASAAVVVAGLLVGWLMRKAGYGVNGSKLKSKEH